MSAFAQKSDGIADTHLHWDEVEQEMQSALGTKATFGSEKSFKNIGEGNGFLSRICLIKPDWQNGSEDLPKAFVLKICTPISMMDFSSKIEGDFDMTPIITNIEKLCTNVHNNEVNTYNLLKKYSDTRIPLPKIYASRKFDEVNKLKGFLIMEYFDDLVPCHITDNISINAVKKCLRSVAIWESIGLKFTEEESSNFSKNFLAESFGDMFKEELLGQMRKGLHDLCGAEYENTINDFCDHLVHLMGDRYYRKLDQMPEALGMKRVFCHGDLWSTNILWTKKNGEFDIRGHIDFQTTSLASPAIDLARLFSATLSGADRRKHWKELLETFYGYLKEEVEGEMPYTYEQLEENYKKFIPFGAFFAVPVVAPLLDFIRNNKPDSLSYVEEIVVEKVVALMEDANTHWEPYN